MARAATRKSKAPIGPRGMVAFALVGLLSIAALVIWRRTIAVAENRVVRGLETQKRELTSLRTTLENDTNDAISRGRIVPAAERRLGMHVATELEVRNLAPRDVTPHSRDSVSTVDSAFIDTLVVKNNTNTGMVASNTSIPRAPDAPPHRPFAATISRTPVTSGRKLR